MMGASKIFGLLADDRRRRLLVLLSEGESVDVPDAALDRGGPSASGCSGERPRTGPPSPRRAEIRLRHVDLPKLSAAGLVEWEREDDTVRRGPRFDEIEPLLTVLVDNAAEIPQEVR
ncbi:DUF7344 domain-containing protein [Halosimplex marinum]|uniref:DUF7344 domain-containing protein n=1 Tax=Halosimplex marinum TaxID=3396620 RepID=UPI003F55A38C